MGYVLFWLALILSNFERVNINFRFTNFTVVQRAEGDRCCEISKHSISYSKQPTDVFLSQWVDRFLCGQQSPTVAHDQSQSPRSVNNSFWLAHNFLLSFPFYVNKCKQTKSFVAVSWTPKRQFVENERQLHKIYACKRSSLLNLFFPTIKRYAAFEIHNS